MSFYAEFKFDVLPLRTYCITSVLDFRKHMLKNISCAGFYLSAVHAKNLEQTPINKKNQNKKD